MTQTKKKRTCELWHSKANNSYTFFPADIPNVREQLESDAECILTVEASSWKEACQQYYDYLGWGMYTGSDVEDLYGDWPL